MDSRDCLQGEGVLVLDLAWSLGKIWLVEQFPVVAVMKSVLQGEECGQN